MKASEAQIKILKEFSRRHQLSIIKMINSAMDAQADYIINDGARNFLAEREAWRNLKAVKP